MSLTPKRRLTAKQQAANRANGPRSRGAVTAEGQARSAAASLRHGYYSKSAEGALAALGEDPAEFQRRLDSLIAAHEPANALEMGLVAQLARALWRMERFHRIAESIVVKHLEQVTEQKEQIEAIVSFPLFAKIERLKTLYGAICLVANPEFGPEEMKLFENCRADVHPEKAQEILRLLLALRKPGSTTELASPADSLGDVSVAEGEERKAAWRKLHEALAQQIESIEKKCVGEDKDEAREQVERDIILAAGQPDATLMHRGEESSLRQVWRITNLLMRIKKEAQATQNIENEE